MVEQYLKIIRLHIVVGGLLAFAVGALLGLANGGIFNPLYFVVCYATVFFGDLSTHFSNDYFDVKQDKARHKKLLFSSNNVLTDNPEMLPLAKNSGCSSCDIASDFVFCGYFQYCPFGVGVDNDWSQFFGFYSSPPLRLVSRGFGEFAIALAFGFAIPAAGYLSNKGAIDNWYGLFVVSFILYGFMLALSLEASDVEDDRLGDKKTLGVTKGVGAVFTLTFSSAFIAFLVLLYFALQPAILQVNLFVITTFSSIPLVAGLIGLLQVRKGKNAQMFSAINVVSLFTINLLILGYLIVILCR